MRRGQLHQYVGSHGRGVGLSQVLAGRASIDDALHDLAGAENVKAITTGQIPPNPSELLMIARAGMRSMRELEESMKRFSRQNGKVSGFVFNGYQQAHAEYGGYYNYEYRSAG